MKILLLAAVMLLPAKAQSLELLKLEDTYLSSYKYINYFDRYMEETSGEQAVYGVDLGFDTYLIKTGSNRGIYFNPNIHFIGTDNQVRRGGLIYELGINFGNIQMFYYHESMHIMDTGVEYLHYPLDDHVGIKIHFK